MVARCVDGLWTMDYGYRDVTSVTLLQYALGSHDMISKKLMSLSTVTHIAQLLSSVMPFIKSIKVNDSPANSCSTGFMREVLALLPCLISTSLAYTE